MHGAMARIAYARPPTPPKRANGHIFLKFAHFYNLFSEISPKNRGRGNPGTQTGSQTQEFYD
jgi:hypothetical protein